MSEERRTAVSYTRFSALKQAAGDSEDRQEREYKAFCERHNLTPGKEVFVDRGRSGYHGTHRKRGALGVLVEAAKAGRFEPGTVVVVEAWDRLGRLRPDKQIELIAELLRTGVSIGVCRLNETFSEDDFASHKWTTLSVFISLAFNESKQKSDRLKSVWLKRRQRVRGGEHLGGYLPGWIERVGGEFRLIPERVAAVKRIYTLALSGLGVTRIVQTLTKEKVKPFRFRVWTKAYVAQLLRDRKVLGEYQPKVTRTGKDQVRRDEPEGAVVRDYYPAAVTEEEFLLVRAAQGQKGRRGPRQRKYANVFRGLLVLARDGKPLNIATTQDRHRKARLVLRSDDTKTYIPYSLFERCVLGQLQEVRPSDVLPTDGRAATTTADTIRAKIAAVRTDLSGLKADLAKSYSKGLADVLRVKEDEEVQLVNDLSDELARTARPLSKAWDEAQSLMGLLDAAATEEEKDALRLRIRAALAAVVSVMEVGVNGNKKRRVVSVIVRFSGSPATRTFAIAYHPMAKLMPENERVQCLSYRLEDAPNMTPAEIMLTIGRAALAARPPAK